MLHTTLSVCRKTCPVIINKKHKAKGFTLIEILISLAILTVISLFLLSFLTPWMTFKQKLDTDRKLTEMKSLITSVYERNAWAVDSVSTADFTYAGGVLSTSTLTASRACNSQLPALTALASYFTDGLPSGESDGYGNTFCFLISPRLPAPQNGVTLYYHNVAVVSAGRDMALDAGTSIDAVTGALTLGGDDTGVLINGYTIADKKYRETAARLARVATMYESYFTAKFLENAARDVTIDYFGNTTAGCAGAWDATGTIGCTAGAIETPAVSIASVLSPLGIGPEEGQSSYESNNTMYVANYNETLAQASGTTTVRSSNGGAAPPFTALLYAALPGPQPNYVIKVAVGNY